jgi:hypothetical protein
MSPSVGLRELVIRAAARWQGLRAAIDPETRLRARLAMRTELKRLRRERRIVAREAVRAHRALQRDRAVAIWRDGGAA